MISLLGEGSSESDGAVSVAEKDLDTVHDLLSPKEFKDLQPTKILRNHRIPGYRDRVPRSRAQVMYDRRAG